MNGPIDVQMLMNGQNIPISVTLSFPTDPVLRAQRIVYANFRCPSVPVGPASSGVHQVQQQSRDLVLSDSHMHPMNGAPMLIPDPGRYAVLVVTLYPDDGSNATVFRSSDLLFYTSRACLDPGTFLVFVDSRPSCGACPAGGYCPGIFFPLPLHVRRLSSVQHLLFA
jgi:hypothetical protein